MRTIPMSPDGDGMPSQPFDLPTIPPELQESVRRHQQHLAALVSSLRAAGLDEELVEASISQLLESYRAELTRAMCAITQEHGHA